MTRTLYCLLATALLPGCKGGPYAAPTTAALDVPNDIEIAWSMNYNNYFDGRGLVLFTQVGVYEGDTTETERFGMPLENVEVQVTSGYAGVYLIPEDALLQVASPSVPDDWQTNWDEYCTDENGDYDPSLNEWCAWATDDNGQFFMLSGEYADADGYAPNYYVGATNGFGRLPLTLYVDSLPTGSAGDFTAVAIFVQINARSDSFSISPGSG